MSVIARLKAAGVETYSRAEWGSVRPAAYAKRRTTHPMPAGPADYHFLHITVTPDTDTVLEGKAGARKVESYGLSTPPMVSYQALVSNEGKWFEGQDYGTKGTHTINDKNVARFPHDLNKFGYAQAIMQNVGDTVTDIQVKVLAMGYAAAELDGRVVRGAPIYPHQKFANKACPGPKAIARLPEIQRLKDYYVTHGLPKVGSPPGDNPTPTPQKDWDEMATEAQVEAASYRGAYRADQQYGKDFWTAKTGTGTALIKTVAAQGVAIAELARFVKADDAADDAAFAAAMAKIDAAHDELQTAIEELAAAEVPTPPKA